MGVHLLYGHVCQVWACILSISVYPTYEVHAYMLDVRLYEVLRAYIRGVTYGVSYTPV
jgi:hypothetical protein